MAKGEDGFAQIGPAMLALGAWTRARCTWSAPSTESERLRQDTTGADLIFTFYAQIVADLSRFMTLEPGDVIRTGTPAGRQRGGAGRRDRGDAGGRRGRPTSTVVEARAPA